jgi:hypothetical protein
VAVAGSHSQFCVKFLQQFAQKTNHDIQKAEERERERDLFSLHKSLPDCINCLSTRA